MIAFEILEIMIKSINHAKNLSVYFAIIILVGASEFDSSVRFKLIKCVNN